MHLLDRVSERLRETSRTMLQDGDQRLTQHDVARSASAIAHGLGTVGSAPQRRIAIALPAGIPATLSIYAVLSAGACYVSLDVTQPGLRLRSIVLDAGVHAVIGRGSKAAWCPEAILWHDVDRLLAGSAPPWRLDVPGGESLAAILYTSGSSGRPKGIALSHRAMRAFADWAGTTFAVKSGDRIASLAPPYFDLSVFDLFTSLDRGALVDFMPRSLALSPSRMADWLEGRNSTIWYTVPSMLGFLALKGGLASRDFSRLTRVLFAGEVMPSKTLSALLDAMPGTSFYNLFGPTETNVCCYWPVVRERVDIGRSIPIGKAASKCRLSIETGTQQLLVQGPSLMSGYVRGDGLGYVRGDGLDLPLGPAGWYGTGDKVERGPNGELLFLGRLDSMVKIAGHRIEPAEVETVLLAHPSIRACCVQAIRDVDGPRLMAAIEADDGPTRSELRAWLHEHLPRFMYPKSIQRCKVLPRFGNGKLDRQQIRVWMLSEDANDQ